jgi:DNA-binding MarR family transcriptional regulator
MTSFDDHSTPLPRRLREGIERLAAVMRSEQWSAANAIGLNPTQANVLALLAARYPDGLRVKAIAEYLGVSQPTATDSLAALERKHLITKEIAPSDSRAISVRISPEGQGALRSIAETPSAMEVALGGIGADEQGQMLRLLIKVIRDLQQTGRMPVQRVCVTCRHFQPYRYCDAANPHHCAFVNAAFGDRHLRLDCADHEPADPALQSANWAVFDSGSASLQVKPHI